MAHARIGKRGCLRILAKWPSVELAQPKDAECKIKSIFQQYNTWMGWLEEGFADAFATLIVGPEYAKSAQDILIRQGIGAISDLHQDDGEHPMPALRPYVSLETLKIIGAQMGGEFEGALGELVQVLEQDWSPIWQKAENDFQVSGCSATRPGDLKKHIASVLHVILNTDLFVPRDKSLGQTVSLLDSVEYWGKGGTKTIEEIGQLTERYRVDSLQPLAERMAAGIEDQSPRSEPAVALDDPFGKLLEHVRRNRDELAQEDKLLTEEWQDILDLELAISHGHTGCKSHFHWIKHRHTSLGIELCP